VPVHRNPHSEIHIVTQAADEVLGVPSRRQRLHAQAPRKPAAVPANSADRDERRQRQC